MASSSLPEVQSFGGQWSKSASLQQDNSNVDGGGSGGGGGNSGSITSAGILQAFFYLLLSVLRRLCFIMVYNNFCSRELFFPESNG
jgi:hypothetical protein